MIAVTAFALSCFFFLVAAHPFVTYPLSLLVLRRWRRAPGIATMPPVRRESFAICFCAYNEERVIEAKMQNLMELRREVPDLDILVYVDAATDRTAERLRPYADRIKLHVSPERHGKTFGMNLLVGRTKAPVVVFTDANVMLDRDALANLRRYFADPAIGCVCGHLRYVNDAESPTAGLGALYWRQEEALKQLESETGTGSVMGADGSLFAIRHALHRNVPDDMIDDMYLSFSILCDGHRVVRADDVRAFEEATLTTSEEFRRKVRIACQAFNVHRRLWPRLRRMDAISLYKYLSHKLLRWLSIYSLLLSFLCFEAAAAAAGLALPGLGLAVVAAVALYLGQRWRVKPFAQCWEILTTLFAAGVGVWRSLRGEKFQTWTPAASVRK